MENFIQLSTDFLSIFSSSFPHQRPSFFHTKFKRQQYLRYVLEIIVDRIVGWLNPRSWYLFHFGNYLRSSSFWFKNLWCEKLFFYLLFIHGLWRSVSVVFATHTHIHTLSTPFFHQFTVATTSRIKKKQRKKWIQLANNTSLCSTTTQLVIHWMLIFFAAPPWHFTASLLLHVRCVLKLCWRSLHKLRKDFNPS